MVAAVRCLGTDYGRLVVLLGLLRLCLSLGANYHLPKKFFDF